MPSRQRRRDDCPHCLRRIKLRIGRHRQINLRNYRLIVRAKFVDEVNDDDAKGKAAGDASGKDILREYNKEMPIPCPLSTSYAANDPKRYTFYDPRLML